MAKLVYINLTTVGGNIDYVDLYQDSDGYSKLLNASPVFYSDIQSGIIINVDDSATKIRVNPVGLCSSKYADISIQSEIATTTTSTTTLNLSSFYLASSSLDACARTGGQILTNVYGITPAGADYCSITTINSPEIASLAPGTYYISSGGYTRSWTKSSTPTNLYNPSVCTSCPTTTTTILS